MLKNITSEKNMIKHHDDNSNATLSSKVHELIDEVNKMKHPMILVGAQKCCCGKEGEHDKSGGHHCIGGGINVVSQKGGEKE